MNITCCMVKYIHVDGHTLSCASSERECFMLTQLKANLNLITE